MNDSVTIKFKAKGQTLTNLDKTPWYASNTIDYVYAKFELDSPWRSFSTVSAVWHSGENTVATLLDTDGKCMVPPEVLDEVSQVSVNLVGSTEENGVVTARLTTFPALALTVHTKSLIFGSETEPITANQFEQFVDKARNMVISQVVAITLATGLPATATYSNGVLTLGLPKGDTGDTGVTPDFSIGTVTTGEPGTDVSVTLSGTEEAPVLNFQIPRGAVGETGKSAYQYAVEDGYEGTEAQYRTLMGDLTTAVEDATEEALKSEGYAVGTQSGDDVGSDSPYYENNSKYYSEQAADSALSASGDASSASSDASSASTNALKSEGYAVGSQNGTEVSSGTYYLNNAKYYKEQAASSATTAGNAATSASGSATSASGSATSASTNALKAEGYSVGKQNGTDVTSGSTYYHNNAKYYNDQAGDSATSASSSASSAEGSALISEGYAKGTQNGTPATSGEDYYHDNAKYYSEAAADSAAAAAESAASLVMDTELDEDSTNAVQNKVITAALSTKAEEDGYYEEMSVGNAEQLISSIYEEDQAPYLHRPTAGALEVGDRAYVKAIVGGTVAWNQLIPGSRYRTDGSYAGLTSVRDVTNAFIHVQGTTTFVDNFRVVDGAWYERDHVYLAQLFGVDSPDCCIDVYDNVRPYGQYYRIWKTSFITLALAFKSGVTINADIHCDIIDLTALFGSSTIADYLLSLEQTTAGAGKAKLKDWGFDIDKHHAYEAVNLQSVNVSAHETVGFNQWDEEWESGSIYGSNGQNAPNTSKIRSKNYIPCLPNTQYYFRCSGSESYLYYYDENKNYITFSQNNIANTIVTPPDRCRYMRFAITETSYNNDICINISDTSKNGEYEPYVKHSYPLDESKELRGIFYLDENNNLCADGDIYLPSGSFTRKYGKEAINPNNLTLVSVNVHGDAICNYDIADIRRSSSGSVTPTFVIANYLEPASTDYQFQSATTSTIAVKRASSGIQITISGCSTLSAVQTYIASHPIDLVYELATPTTETADPYRELQIVDNYGTEEFVDYAYSQGDRDIAVPVGHVTRYTPDLVSKLEELPNPPSGNGDYIMRRSNGTNAYTPLIIPQELPNTPSEDGTYKLVCTVADGTATLSWESEV